MLRYTEAIADVLPSQTEKFWYCLGILLLRYLAPEFRRLSATIKHLPLYPQGDRLGFRGPKKDKQQY